MLRAKISSLLAWRYSSFAYSIRLNSGGVLNFPGSRLCLSLIPAQKGGGVGYCVRVLAQNWFRLWIRSICTQGRN